MQYQVSSDLYLVSQGVSKKGTEKPVEVPTNHIVVIDCSGSMSSELPKIRDQLKKKLPKLIGEKDTLSIIWFSGRGEFGTLLEAEPVATLTDLAEVSRAIDRWLRPIGMTSFREPLQEAAALLKRVSKKNSGVFSLFFVSDGCDNCSSRSQILEALELSSGGLSASTFVEYGYYADRPTLTLMAEKAGGQLIFADQFDRYQPVFESVLGKRLTGAPKVEVSVTGDVVGGFVFTLRDKELTTYAISDGKVLLPEDTTEFWALKSSSEGGECEKLTSVSEKLAKAYTKEITPEISAAFAAVSLFSVRMKSDIVLKLLKSLGDVRFIEAFSSCFGKQKYSEFMDLAKEAAFDPNSCWTAGWDPDKVPDENAFTVLDLLRVLTQDKKARILLDSPEFKYSRISRGTLDANEVLTAEEQAKIAEITERMSQTKKASEQKKLQEELAAVTAGKKESLKFEKDENPDGYPVCDLTYNESRPNVSILVRKTGTVDLTGRAPEELKLPASFKTFIYRSYAIIADGLVGVDRLPIRVSPETAEVLARVLPNAAKPPALAIRRDYVEGTINLRALPVINRSMVQEVSAESLFRKCFELLQTKAAQKVYNYYLGEVEETRKSASFEETYGKEAADWLKEEGFTDYSGFSPKRVQAESTDFYLGKELKVSLKGLSSLPKVLDVKAKLASAKRTASVEIMCPYVQEIESLRETHKDEPESYRVAIKALAEKTTDRARSLMYDISTQKFSIVVGQVWPREFSDLSENTMTLKFDKVGEVLCTLEMKEVQVRI